MLDGGFGGRICTIEPDQSSLGVLISRFGSWIGANNFESFDIDVLDSADVFPTGSASRIAENFSDLFNYFNTDWTAAKKNADAFKDNLVTVEALKNLSDYKIIIYEGHGG